MDEKEELRKIRQPIINYFEEQYNRGFLSMIALTKHIERIMGKPISPVEAKLLLNVELLKALKDLVDTKIFIQARSNKTDLSNKLIKALEVIKKAEVGKTIA